MCYLSLILDEALVIPRKCSIELHSWLGAGKQYIKRMPDNDIMKSKGVYGVEQVGVPLVDSGALFMTEKEASRFVLST